MSKRSTLGGGEDMVRRELVIFLQCYVEATCWQDGRIQMEPEVCEVILRNLGGFAEAHFGQPHTSLDIFSNFMFDVLLSDVRCQDDNFN
jgi:hypothetical protein